MEHYEKAFARMLELLDLTIVDKRWKGYRKRELARIREAICDSFEGGQSYKIPLSDWPKYFMPFAIYARRNITRI